MSTNPNIQISSGTLSPASWIALIAPIAILSLLANIAVGLSSFDSNSLADSYPDSSRNFDFTIKEKNIILDTFKGGAEIFLNRYDGEVSN